jgi:hypothetical protein
MTALVTASVRDWGQKESASTVYVRLAARVVSTGTSGGLAVNQMSSAGRAKGYWVLLLAITEMSPDSDLGFNKGFNKRRELRLHWTALIMNGAQLRGGSIGFIKALHPRKTYIISAC